VLDVLERAPRRSYTHYTLCDAPDWMDAATQQQLLRGILRTAKDGAIVMHRSVETEPMIERLGMDRQLVPLGDRTERASRLDRSRMYRAVRFYRVTR
jgi:S-adenosylmethionine-diacylglycerol 3-amino-3-carboxypropyl transferase